MAHQFLPDFKSVFSLSTSTDQDSKYDLFLEAAENRVLHEFGVVVSPLIQTTKLKGKGTVRLFPTLSPINTVTAITDADGATVDISDIFIDSNIIETPATIYTKGSLYNVTADYGFAVGAVPSDLKFAIMKLAFVMLNDVKQNPSAKAATNMVGDKTTFVEIDIPKAALQTFKAYAGIFL